MRLDPDADIPIYSEVCTRCRHYDRDPERVRQCAAFPDGIPMEIWQGKNLHREPYPGDSNIQFAPME